jgi:hypothetical protein
MMAEEIVLAIGSALERVGIPYMTVGALAGNYYGINRATDDADFVIQVDDVNLTALRQALGPGFVVDPQAKFETISLSTYYVVQHPDTDFDIDLFLLRDDHFDRLSFSRRKRIAFDRGETFICTAEDYVVTKISWASKKRRAKDSEDARAVLAVQQGKLNLDYIRHWCELQGTRELLEKTINSIPPIPQA